MLKILFICAGNSCRSQMAEGWMRELKAGLIEPYSAGIENHGLHPDGDSAGIERLPQQIRVQAYLCTPFKASKMVRCLATLMLT
jgi:protein-tyrosine-phosphatase